MTEKLFYEDSYMQTFEADVLACERFDDNYKVELDKTAFFPEGGGQSGDRGFLNGIAVSDTWERDGIVYHIINQPISPGTRVSGEIDFKERFSKMQQHTGEHIISGIVCRRFGYNNVGFHLGSEVVTMDFDGGLNEDELSEIEFQANEIASSNRKVEISYPVKADLIKMEYRSKIEIEGQVRIVTIPCFKRLSDQRAEYKSNIRIPVCKTGTGSRGSSTAERRTAAFKRQADLFSG